LLFEKINSSYAVSLTKKQTVGHDILKNIRIKILTIINNYIGYPTKYYDIWAINPNKINNENKV
jgi:hypothetical protein